jgi:MFS family permease
MVGRQHLRNAVTLGTITNNVARAIGPAIAGIAIVTVGAGWCFFINGVSFVLVIIALVAIRKSELLPAQRAPRLQGQVAAGLRYVAHQPVLRNALIMGGVVGLFTYEFQTTLPLMAGGPFHSGAETYGFLAGCVGVGAALGGLVFAALKSRSSRHVPLLALVFGVVVLLAALAPQSSRRGSDAAFRRRRLGWLHLPHQQHDPARVRTRDARRGDVAVVHGHPGD